MRHLRRIVLAITFGIVTTIACHLVACAAVEGGTEWLWGHAQAQRRLRLLSLFRLSVFGAAVALCAVHFLKTLGVTRPLLVILSLGVVSVFAVALPSIFATQGPRAADWGIGTYLVLLASAASAVWFQRLAERGDAPALRATDS